MDLLGLRSGLRSQSAAVGTIVVCDVLPFRIGSGTMRTFTIGQSSQSLRCGAQMRIRGKETFIQRFPPSFCSGSLSLSLLDRLMAILPPLF